MHLGFATLESGLTRSKSTANILFENTFVVCATMGLRVTPEEEMERVGVQRGTK